MSKEGEEALPITERLLHFKMEREKLYNYPLQREKTKRAAAEYFFMSGRTHVFFNFLAVVSPAALHPGDVLGISMLILFSQYRARLP